MSEKRKKKTSERVTTQSVRKEKIQLLNNEDFTQNKNKDKDTKDSEMNQKDSAQRGKKVKGSHVKPKEKHEQWGPHGPSLETSPKHKLLPVSVFKDRRDKYPRCFRPVWLFWPTL